MTCTLLTGLRNQLEVERLVRVDDRVVPIDREITAEVYANWLVSPDTLPPKPEPELRPCHFTSSVSQVDEYQFVQRTLLACDSVALVLPDSVSYLPRLIRMLVLCEDLLDAGVLHLVPEGAVKPFRLLDQQLALASVDSGHGELANREKFAAEWLARAELAASIDASAALRGRADLAVTSRAQIHLIEQLAAGRLRPQQLATSDEVAFIPDLLTLELPDLRLRASDLLSVRQEGALDDLRRIIREATASAMSLDPEIYFDPDRARSSEFRQQLDQAALKILYLSQRSTTLRNAAQGVSLFAVGCATGAAGAMGGPAVGAAAGGLSVLGAGLAEWLHGRPSKGQRGLRRVLSSF